MKTVITYNLNNFKKIKDIFDFYKAFGIERRFSKNDIADVSQLQISENDCNELKNIILKNAKDKDSAYLQWLNYSPAISTSMPNNTLYIFSTIDEALTSRNILPKY